LADDPNERRQIAEILLISRRNNEELEVTGALLVTDRNFAQVLEGEREAVEATYERIARDKRHKDIVLTLYESIEVRRFPDWAMAYIGPSQSAEQAVARVTSKVPACKTGQAARALVTSMSQMLAEQSRADALVPAAE
jgi:FAD-dependent sensor of blue light